MASRRAIVAGPQSYLEIGAGTGGGTDYLVVGSEGVVGAGGSVKLYGDDTGSGTDKTIIIGEQGAVAGGTNIVHFFGTSTGPASLEGIVKIHGNLEVEGTENVLGDATFDADATFKGNTTFGDQATDTVTFMAGVASDFQFDAVTGGGGTRTIDIEASTGAGTSLVIGAGDAGGAGPSNGGDITVLPGAPQGGDYGEVLIGNPARVDPNDGKSGPAMLLNTGNANEAGFRWNSSDTKLQYRLDNTTTWVDLVGGGGTLPPSSDTWSLLQGNAGNTWTETFDLTLPEHAGAGRFVTVEASTTATGDDLTVSAGASTGTGGSVWVSSGAGTTAGGNVNIGNDVDTAEVNLGYATGTHGIKITNSTDTEIFGDLDLANAEVTSVLTFQASASATTIRKDNGPTGSLPGTFNIRGATTGDGSGGGGGAVEISAGGGGDNSAGLGGAGGDLRLETAPGGDGTGAAGGAGGNMYLTAHDGGAGTTQGNGGNILIEPGEGATNGQIVFGNGSFTDHVYTLYNSADGYSATGPGFRYNVTSGEMEFSHGALWQAFGTGSVPDGTNDYDRLYWDETGGGSWNATSDIMLGDDLAGDRRIYFPDTTATTVNGKKISIEGQTAGTEAAGGDIVIVTGDGGASAGAAAGGEGGWGGLEGGSGGAGDATQNAGAGGSVYMLGGQAGTAGAGGGAVGGIVSLQSGPGTGAFASGTVTVYSADGVANNSGVVEVASGSCLSGTSGNMFFGSGNATTGDSGDVIVKSGTSTSGTTGDVNVYASASGSGTYGALRMFNEIQLVNAAFDTYAQVFLNSDSDDHSYGGYGTGTRFNDNMYWSYNSDGVTIGMEKATVGQTGGSMTFRGGHGPDGDGGGTYIESGDGGNGSGGAIQIQTGSGGGAAGPTGHDGAQITINTSDGTPGLSTGGTGGDVIVSLGDGGSSVIGIDGQGGTFTVNAGDGAGDSGSGGNIKLFMGDGGTGISTPGQLFFGPSTGYQQADAYQIIANTDDATAEAGLRYNNAAGEDVWQLRFDGDTEWYDILTSSTNANVQAGTDTYQILQWNHSTTTWERSNDMTLPESADRTISIETAVSGDGDSLTIVAGAAADGAGGDLNLYSGALALNEHASGNVDMASASAAATTSSSGTVDVHSGAGLGDSNATGAVSVYSGTSVGELSGDVSVYSGDAGGTGGVSGGLDLHTGDSTSSTSGSIQMNSGSGTAAGAVIVQVGDSASGKPGALHLYGGDAGPANANAGGTTSLRSGGSFLSNGGPLQIEGGSGNGGDGGSVSINGGEGGTGNGGDVIVNAGQGSVADGTIVLGDENTVTVQFGGSESTRIDFLGDGDNRVVSDILFNVGNKDIRFPDAAGAEVTGSALLVRSQNGGVSTGAAAGGDGGAIQLYGAQGGAGNGAQSGGDGGTADLRGGTGGNAGTGHAGQGGNVAIHAGSAGTGGDANGGWVAITATIGTANGDSGAITLRTYGAAGTGDDGYLLFNTPATDGADTVLPWYVASGGGGIDTYAGLRYNDTNDLWEYRNDSAASWSPLVGAGGTLPASEREYDRLVGDATGGWTTDNTNLILPKGGTRLITIDSPDSGDGDNLNITAGGGATTSDGAGSVVLYGGSGGSVAGDGGDMTIRGGDAPIANGGTLSLLAGDGGTAGSPGTATLQAGEAGRLAVSGGTTNVKGGTGFATGIGGTLNLLGGEVSGAGTGGLVLLQGGPAVDAGGTGGDLELRGGAGTTQADYGTLHMYGGISFDDYTTGTLFGRVDLQSKNLTNTSGSTGFATGTRFSGDTEYGMVWEHKTEGYRIAMENAPTGTGGGRMTFQAGAGDGAGSAGGDTVIRGGAAGTGATGGVGGSVDLIAPAGGAGTTTLGGTGGAINVATGAGGATTLGAGADAGDMVVTLGAGSDATLGAGGDGGNFRVLTGEAGSGPAGTAAAGSIYLLTANPENEDYEGSIFFGNTTSPTTTDAYQIFANTSGTYKGGIRYNHAEDQWEVTIDNDVDEDWQPLVTGSGGSVPDGDNTYQHLEWIGGAWSLAESITLPENAGSGRTISVEQSTANGDALTITSGAGLSSGNTSSGDLTLQTGAPNAFGASGGVNIYTADSATNGATGDINLKTGDTGVGSGNVNIQTGEAAGTASGNILIQVGQATTQAGGYVAIQGGRGAQGGGDVSISGGQSDGTQDGGHTHINGGSNSSTGDNGNVFLGDSSTEEISFGGQFESTKINFLGHDDTRVISDIVFEDSTARSVYMETNAAGDGQDLSVVAGATSNAASAGGDLALTGGASTTGAAGSVDITGGAATSGDAGSVTITGGASASGVNGGSVVINGGAAGGGPDGFVHLGVTNTSLVRIGGATNNFSFDVDAAIPLLSFGGTANIDLPGGSSTTTENFLIDGTNVGELVTAANLDTLTDGSNADALHTHAGLGSFDALAGENLTQYSLLAMAPNGSSLPRAYMCDITAAPGDTGAGPLPVGFAATGATSGNSESIQQTGEVTIPSGRWQALPSTAQIGMPVYAYATIAGGVSLTAPVSGSGDYRTRVGVVTARTASDATIAINIGDSVLMS